MVRPAPPGSAAQLSSAAGECRYLVEEDVSEETVFPPFQVSLAAIAQIETVGGSVRIDVAPGGCCGQKYVFTASEATAAEDEFFGCPGAALILSPAALITLTGAKLDYGPALSPPRFRVTGNPDTPQRCPCNRSFSGQWPGRGHPDCQPRLPMPWD